MANMYNTGIQDLMDGTIQWGTSDMRCILLTSSYTFDADHDFVDDVSTWEITQGGRAGLDGETTVLDLANDEVSADATDETYSALTAGDTPSQIVIYKFNASDAAAELLCRCALTTPPAPNGGDYTIVWDAEGVFKISN